MFLHLLQPKRISSTIFNKAFFNGLRNALLFCTTMLSLSLHAGNSYPFKVMRNNNHSPINKTGSPVRLSGYRLSNKLPTGSTPNNGASASVVQPALSGTFTIGGASPDFANFTGAVNALNNYGVSGPVVFNVRNGVYTEQLRLLNTAGTSETNTVTFQSESGLNTNVTLTYASTDDSANYTLQLNRADFFTFNNISIEATGGTYGTVIDIRGGSESNTISNCILKGIHSGDEYAAAVIYSSSGNSSGEFDNNNSFLDNKIIGGASGIRMQAYNGGGGSESRAAASGIGVVGTIIEGNQFINQLSSAIFLQNLDGGIIRSNTISADSSSAYYFGMHLETCYNNLRIEKNKLNSKGGYGIYLYNCYPYSGGEEGTVVSNNFIHIAGNSNAYGIYSQSTAYLKILYNSISVSSTDSYNSRALQLYYPDHMTVQNNIASNTGQGYSLFTYYPYQSVFDYNDYFSNGSTLAFWNGDQAGLASLQSAGGQDQHSISADPLFTSGSDLHTTAAALNGKGKSSSDVSDDIDGQLRSLLPDIGADEFFADSLDAALISIASPQTPFAAGTNAVKTVLLNNANTPLSSATINWQINGVVQAAYNWTGSLASGDTSVLTLGSASFVIDSLYNISAWVSSPNGSADQAPANDTTSADSLYAALAGTYTIGGSSPDFDNFTHAIATMQRGGVLAAVTFNVRNGIYDEQISIPEIAGVNAANTVTFQSQAGDSSLVTLRYSATNSTNNYVIQLNGADHISFRKLGLEAQGTYYSKVIDILNGATANSFSNNSIRALTTTNTSTDQSLVYSYASYQTNNHGNKFNNNFMRGGSYGLYAYGYNSGFGYTDTGLVVSGNKFTDQYYMGLNLNNLSGPRIISNTLSTTSSYPYFYGFYLYSCNNGTALLKNKVIIPNGEFGMYMQYCSGNPGTENRIANNFISIGGNYSSAYGLYLYYSSYTNVYHNSVNITNSIASSAAYYQYNSSNQSVLNNIFSNSGGGYAVYFPISAGNTINEDYNNYYTSGPNLAYWNGNRHNLGEWQTASSFDASSISINPNYPSFSDLHLNKASLNNSGIALTDVTDDIDGESRQTHPDMGADEFNVIGENAALFALLPPAAPFAASTALPVRVKIRNSGQSALTSFTINWTVNALAQSTVNWTGSLPVGGVDTITIGTYAFAPATSHTIKAWASMPNGTTDIDHDDDTSKVEKIYAALTGTYTIGGSSPDFTNFTQAAEVLNKAGVLGAVTFNARPGTYNEQVSLVQFPGSSCATTVTFQSENGDSSSVVLHYNANYQYNYTVQLDGTDGITFKKLSIKADNTYYARVIDIHNAANCNRFLNNAIIGAATPYNYGDVMSVVYSTYSSDNNTIFKNNLIKDGVNGIQLMGDYSLREKGTVIENNTFQNQLYRGISLQYADSILVTNNTINNSTNYNGYIGIWLSTCNNNIFITKNRISSSLGGTGLSMESCNAPSPSASIVANNFISMGGTSTSRGIYSYSSSNNTLAYNSINITGTNTAESQALSMYYSSSLNIYNNIFYNAGGGYAVYSIYSYNTSADRNDLFSSGTNLGFWNYATYPNLTSWKQGTGIDSNSISVNPLFTSFTNLHSNLISLNAKAKVLAIISDDIDAQPRDPSAPDIGADEFDTKTVDAGLLALSAPTKPFAVGNRDVSVLLINNSDSVLNNVNINWLVNGSTQPVHNWVGSLASGDTVSVNIGSFSFALKNKHLIKAWTSLPNGIADLNPTNDTLQADSLYAALGGTYTLGGTSPDFSNFTEAVTTLSLGGVMDAVIFKVRTAAYNEQVSIPQIKGSSAEHDIVFESESGDSSSVLLNFAAGSAKNYLVQLNGADYVSFRKMSFEAKSPNYGIVFDIRNGSNNNKFLNNNIKGQSTTSGTTNLAVFYSPNVNNLNDNNNEIKNNLVKDGSYAAVFYGSGSYSTAESGTVIENNIFQNQGYNTIQLQNQLAPLIAGNTITQTADVYFYGIQLQYIYGNTRIVKNKISIHHGYGIYQYSSNASFGTEELIANNFISLGIGSSSSYGMYLYYPSYTKIYNNTIHNTSSYSGSGALFAQYGSNLSLRNNILASTGGGYALYNYYNSGFNSNNNDLYTNGPTIGYWFGTNQTTLAAWQSASSQDINSVSVEPHFVSASDLHISPLLSIAINAKGTPLTEVPLDIDGQLRDQVSPDIGADEFSTTIEDAGILSIASPKKPFAAGNNTVTAFLLNNANLQLDSVTVNWSVNGQLQTPTHWTGTLAAGDTTLITLGNFSFAIDTMYSVVAWTSFPNGLADEEPRNDTARVDSLYPGLSGAYTIGGTSPDFNTINNAVEAMKRGGVLGAVTFNLRNGVYTEQVLLPSTIAGISASRTVEFKSESNDSSAVTITYNASSASDNYVVLLDGSDYITFSKLTLEASNTSYGRVLELRNGATNNRFLNNYFKGVVTTSTSNTLSVIYSGNATNTGDNNNEFKYNRIKNGSIGADLSAVYGYWETGMVIEGNTFENQYTRAIQLYALQGAQIKANTILSTVNSYDYSAIYETYGRERTLISKNKIALSRGYGIYKNSCSATIGNEALTANNFIQITGADAAIGITMNSSGQQKIYHNSVQVNTSNYYPANCVALSIYGGSELKIRNNILVAYNKGYAVNLYYPGTNVVLNYNDLYSTGPNLAYFNAERAGLSEWKTASGQDANSVSVNPLFVAANDLHTTEGALNNVGTPLTEVTDDIDGEVRSVSHPDIGADEFSPAVNNDAGIVTVNTPVKPFAAGIQAVSVSIKNYGAGTLNTATIKWEVNGVAQADYNWTGTLAQGQKDSIVIGTYSFVLLAEHSIVAWTVNPNGTQDSVSHNDTTVVNKLYPALAGTYTIGGTNPGFFNFTEALTALTNGGVVGPVNFLVRNGTFEEQISIPSIDGSSATNTISFSSQSGDSSLVRLGFNGISWAKNYVVQLDGADYISFKHITIEARGTFGMVVDIRNGANNSSFTNNIIRGVNTTNPDWYYAAVYAPSTPLSNQQFVFKNNAVKNGSEGLNFAGYYTNPISGSTIEGNTFENQSRAAIDLSYFDAVQIKSNTITTNSTRDDFNGIRVNNGNNAMLISRNKIAVNGGYGIYEYYCNGTAGNEGTVVNNFVSTGGTSTAYGITLYNSPHQKILFNNVNVSSTHSTEGRAFYTYSGYNLSLSNNNFANTGAGYAIYFDYLGSYATYDYNNYYTAGSVLGYLSGNKTNFAAWKSAGFSQDEHSLSIDPLYYSASDLHINQIALDSAGLPLAGINTDIEGDVRNATKPDIGADEFVYRPNDIGASLLMAPANGCGLDSAGHVTIQITNYGGLPQSGFNVAYSVNGGAYVVENVGALHVMPGGKINYTFTAKVNVATPGVYSFKLYAALTAETHHENDTLLVSINSYPQLNTAPANLQPANLSTDLFSPIAFSWSPAPNALYYDLYVWIDTIPMPAVPTVSGITGINYSYYNYTLKFGSTYKWRVVARNSCSDTSSVVQSFVIRNLPDLVVNSIQVPASAFSGQTVNIDWTIKNKGSGSTGSQQWYELIYLSADTILTPNLDKYLGGTANLSALNTNQSYAQTTSFTLPQGIAGNYYILIKTDGYSNVQESNENNNLSHSLAIPVTLTPPPDLRVYAIVTPQDAFSGQTMNVNWTVKNTGPGETKVDDWNDRLFISSDSILSANDVKLGEYSHHGKLKTDSSYTSSKPVLVPDGISGTYYIFVQTDVLNTVYEYVYEANNTRRSDSIHVILSPPVDYVVTSVHTVRNSVSNKDTLTVRWTVENQGGSTPTAVSWTDDIYISQQAQFNIHAAALIGSSVQSNQLQPFTSYDAQKKITIPDTINGPYYIYVFTDANNKIFEHIHENNNTGRTDTNITVLSPDLRVTRVVAPAPDSSGKLVDVQWTVKNNGPGIVVSGTWRDRVYISSNSSFNASAQQIDSLSYGLRLNPGDSSVKHKLVRIPNGLSGTHYMYVYTDALATIYESTQEGNNIGKSNQINVILSPWADLKVTTIQVADTISAGDNTPVQFRVLNDGAAATSTASWKDKVYISKDATWSVNAVLINTSTHTTSLWPDSTYLVSVNAPVPPQLTVGTYYLYVMCDADNSEYEHTNENNNRLRSHVIYVKPYPPVDLAVTAAKYTGATNSGQSVHIDWTVKNKGAGATTAAAWFDAVYLSADSVWDQQSDIFVAEFQKDGPVAANASYTLSKNITLPNGVSGLYYLLLVTDHTFKNPDVDLNNNDRITQDSALSGFHPINIILTSPPDLLVSVFNTPSQITSGQPFTVGWTVKNNGTGNTIKTSWTERIYLSADNQLGGNDYNLGSYVRNGSLNPGAGYADSLQVYIPASLSGNYFLIIKTDNNDVVYEHQAENNNTEAKAVNAVQPPASDLVVSSITVPAAVIAGQSANISWKTKNISNSPVSGSLKEAVYFSKDSLWDINDVLLGTYISSINLAPLGENTKSITAPVPGLALGDYTVLVQTDILNNIFESNDTNNTSYSSKINIDVLNLPINVLTTNTLNDNDKLYYKIEVPDSLTDESLLIKLKADSVNGNNELYVKFGTMPDQVVYDFSQDNPFQGNQEIVIPELDAGTYYLMTTGSTAPANSQNISLFARILNFEIRSVDANNGGNTGSITVLIKGSKFEHNMQLRLKRGATTITADSILFIDPTKVYARFNLSGAALGMYNVEAENAKHEIATLVNGFEVVPGLAPELLTDILHPASTRISSTEVLTIEYTNAGNTDLLHPVLILHSIGGAPVGFSLAELSNHTTDLTIPLQELNGPPGVLRPGAIGSVIIYTKAIATLGFLIEIPKF